MPTIIQTIYKQFHTLHLHIWINVYFLWLLFSGSFTHQFPTDLEVLCDYDIWAFLQLWAPIRTGEGHRQRWDEREGNRGLATSTLQGEQSIAFRWQVQLASLQMAVHTLGTCTMSTLNANVHGEWQGDLLHKAET